MELYPQLQALLSERVIDRPTEIDGTATLPNNATVTPRSGRRMSTGGRAYANSAWRPLRPLLIRIIPMMIMATEKPALSTKLLPSADGLSNRGDMSTVGTDLIDIMR